ncbi:MAG TPA: glycosyltransferase family 25 protein [Leptolyngbya sp.]|nr:glycosyltransferase family 25 protein [Leptolyngbya sp.]
MINLPERLDRRKQIEQELNRAGMPLQPGKVELFEAVKVESAEGFQSIGLRGCFMSHLAIYKQAKQLGLRNVLIFEDDLALSEHFKQCEAGLVEQLQEHHWDLVLFGYLRLGNLPGDLTQPGNPKFSTLEPTQEILIGTHFYAVNAKAFDRLIAAFESVLSLSPDCPGTRFPDGVLKNLGDEDDFLRLKAIPSFAVQRSSRSDCTPRWFDRFPMLEKATGALRASGVVSLIKALALGV